VLGVDARARKGAGFEACRSNAAAAVLVDAIRRACGRARCAWRFMRARCSSSRAQRAPARDSVVGVLPALRIAAPAITRTAGRWRLATCCLMARADARAGGQGASFEYAALSHDIGHSVDHGQHQRHSYYLLKNSELLGFDPEEIEVIALVARGHRKQVPKPSAPELAAISSSKRKLVRGLAAVLRIADALDRTHFGVVKSLSVQKASGRVVIRVDAGAENAELELWAAERRVDLLSRLLDRPVVLRAVASMRPKARRHAS
jgi:hypothetical protein